MDATQRAPYAPALGDPRQFRHDGQGQTWQAGVPVPEPIGPDEFAQQLTDLAALMGRFPAWLPWVQGRRWTATRFTGERIEADSAAEIAARLTGTPATPPGAPPAMQRTVPPPMPPPVTQPVSQGGPQPPPRCAPPVNATHPPAAGVPRVPRMVRQQLGQHGTGEPWQPQSGPQQYPLTRPQQHAQPIQQASGAA